MAKQSWWSRSTSSRREQALAATRLTSMDQCEGSAGLARHHSNHGPMQGLHQARLRLPSNTFAACRHPQCRLSLAAVPKLALGAHPSMTPHAGAVHTRASCTTVHNAGAHSSSTRPPPSPTAAPRLGAGYHSGTTYKSLLPAARAVSKASKAITCWYLPCEDARAPPGDDTLKQNIHCGCRALRKTCCFVVSLNIKLKPPRTPADQTKGKFRGNLGYG